MLRSFFRFIVSIFAFTFEEIADQGKLNKKPKRQKAIITDIGRPIVEEHNLPTIKMD